jgi:hypothetical protein
VPVPAPPPVMDALESVQVTSSKDRSGFQLTFAIGKTSPLQLAMLPAGYFDPTIARVIIVVTLNGMPRVIMDGFVTRQEVQPSNEPGASKLTITGDDLSVAMDKLEMVFPYPAMPDLAKINFILAKYAFLGVTPVVIPPFIETTEMPTRGFETQTVSDLDYVRAKANENGYVFYIEPGPLPGQSIAYFGPDVRLPVPQSALSVNMDTNSNIETLSFSFDGLQKKVEIINILDPVTGRVPIPVPMPEIDIFKPPLGARPIPPAKITYNHDSAALDLSEALQQAIGRGIRS